MTDNDVYISDSAGMNVNTDDAYAYQYAETTTNTNTFRLFVARSLGYLVGFGSLMLYTPIAVRVSRQKHADGLVLSTWWLKLSSYLLSDAYYVRKKYDISTYAETVIITIESIVVLALVAFYQKRTEDASFWIMLSALVLGSLYAFTIAPNDLIALGQLSSVFINTAALVPQFHHNFVTKTKGDYSPLTATLAWAGCLVRIFTTITLNNSDPVLMVTFFSAFCANFTLLLQILYYGTRIEGLSFLQVFMADVATADAATTISANTTTHSHHHDHGSDDDAADSYNKIVEHGDGYTDRLSALQRREETQTQAQTQKATECSALRRRPALEMVELKLPGSAASSPSIAGNDGDGVGGKRYGSLGERINEPGNKNINSDSNAALHHESGILL